MEHRWTEAFPVIAEPLQVTWEPGESLVKPNIFRHNLLRDLAVDGVALRALDAAVDWGLKPYVGLLVDGPSSQSYRPRKCSMSSTSTARSPLFTAGKNSPSRTCRRFMTP